jgi:hypothetical protein
VEEYSSDEGYFHPFLAYMAKSYQGKPLERQTGMTDKVCPFDKQPCIRERCILFREDDGICSFCLLGTPGKPVRPKTEEKKPSGYKAHLFD